MGWQGLLRASVAFVGTLVFALYLGAPAVAESTSKIGDAGNRAETAADIVVTEAHIMLFKHALGLRPEQEHHWVPVEAALRDLAQRPVVATSSRSSGSRFKRLSAAAVPLIRALDENQRRNLEVLSRTFGFEHWLTAH